MKYLLPLFALLLLLGGGCANNTEPQTVDDTQVQSDTIEDAQTIDGIDIIDIKLDGDTTTPLSEDTEIEEKFNEAKLAVEMESGNFYFAPDSITALAGQDITITFTSNTGFHTFVIDEVGLNATVTAGETISFTAPEEPGTYAFYCDVGSHRAFGMEGTLIVE